MTSHTDLVAQVKADLIQRGVIPEPQATNRHSFQITARVAWILRESGARLIVKVPPQNGADWDGVRYSHDSIAFPDGWVDCLKSAGPPDNSNEPAWGPTGASGAQLVYPLNLDAGAVALEDLPPAPPLPPPTQGDPPPGSAEDLEAHPWKPPAIPDADVHHLGTMAIALAGLAQEVQALREQYTFDKELVMAALGTVQSDLTDLRLQDERGWGVTFPGGYTLTLKRLAVPAKKTPTP